MRTREEIEQWVKDADIPGWGKSSEHDWRILRIELLLDIRELLITEANNKAEIQRILLQDKFASIESSLDIINNKV